jgi:4'-phosphopantetheinyl transferase
LRVATDLDAPLATARTHVFLLPLSAAGEVDNLAATQIERVEAEALVPNMRAAFLARRRLLRRAVAKRLAVNPGDVLVAKDAQGAPRITSAREPLFVSLAARGELIAIAISDRPVGIDVEPIDTCLPPPAWNILHRSEREWLSRQTPASQAESFLTLWCVKEAYLKALGLGLGREPAEIAVSFANSEQVHIADAGRPARLDEGYVTRADVHGAAAIIASIVLAR